MMSIGGDWSCMGVGYWSYMMSIRKSISIGKCVSLRCLDSRGRSKDSRISFSITLLASIPSISSVSSVVSTVSIVSTIVSRITIVSAIPGFRAGLSVSCRLTFWLGKSQSDKEEDKNKFHGEAVIESEYELMIPC